METFSIQSPEVTDVGIKRLSSLRLTHLDLYIAPKGSDQPKITDETMRALKKDFTSLRRLGLSGTAITDDGLKNLSGLKELGSITLGNNANMSDAGVKELQNCRKLNNAWLHGPNWTDMALQNLNGHVSLQHLYFVETKMTDSGLLEIKDFKKLSRVWFTDCDGITDAGIAEFRKVHPTIDVQRKTKASDGDQAIAFFKLRESPQQSGATKFSRSAPPLSTVAKADQERTLPVSTANIAEAICNSIIYDSMSFRPVDHSSDVFRVVGKNVIALNNKRPNQDEGIFCERNMDLAQDVMGPLAKSASLSCGDSGFPPEEISQAGRLCEGTLTVLPSDHRGTRN
jgi:hypothetical protein